MPDRKTSFPTPWLRTVLALLAWVLVSPARSTGSDAVPVRPCCHAPELSIASSPPASAFAAATPVDDVPQVNAFFPEGEEQDQVGAPAETLIPYLVLCSFRREAERRPTTPRPIPSLYPLRC